MQTSPSLADASPSFSPFYRPLLLSLLTMSLECLYYSPFVDTPFMRLSSTSFRPLILHLHSLTNILCVATVFENMPMNKQIQVQETIPTLIILFIHFMINSDRFNAPTTPSFW